MVPKIISHAASVVTQNKKDRVQVLCRGTRSKRKRHSPPASLLGSPTTYQLHVWRGGRRQCRVIVRKVMLHTFGETIADCCLKTNVLTLTGKELELVEEAKKYHLDIVGVSST